MSIHFNVTAICYVRVTTDALFVSFYVETKFAYKLSLV
jgi:hypothetical protein